MNNWAENLEGELFYREALFFIEAEGFGNEEKRKMFQNLFNEVNEETHAGLGFQKKNLGREYTPEESKFLKDLNFTEDAQGFIHFNKEQPVKPTKEQLSKGDLEAENQFFREHPIRKDTAGREFYFDIWNEKAYLTPEQSQRQSKKTKEKPLIEKTPIQPKVTQTQVVKKQPVAPKAQPVQQADPIEGEDFNLQDISAGDQSQAQKVQPQQTKAPGSSWWDRSLQKSKQQYLSQHPRSKKKAIIELLRLANYFDKVNKRDLAEEIDSIVEKI